MISEDNYLYTSGEFYMSWFVASDQFRQLSLLWRRYKVKAGLHCTDEAQNTAETYACGYLAPCKSPPFSRQILLSLKPRVSESAVYESMICIWMIVRSACYTSMSAYDFAFREYAL